MHSKKMPHNNLHRMHSSINALSVCCLSINSILSTERTHFVATQQFKRMKYLNIMSSLLFVVVHSFSIISVILASAWDGFPIISQIKSAVLALAGDLDGAKRTQENFIRQMPVLSQITSAVQAATGDLDAAKATQEQFLSVFSVRHKIPPD